jgi:L-fuculose-phosphate aldolase
VKPLRVQVADVARMLHARGWTANHDGNVTARDGARFLATPTATSKRLIGDRDLIEVDAKGQVQGHGKAFGELGLHLAVYARRPDVGCVVHAHPPNATAIASSRANPIERPFLAEAVVSLGPRIPRLPYAQPGDAARAVLAPWCELVDAVLLGNHGVLAWGADPEQAFLRLELIEHLATIAIAAAPLGGVEPLPDAALAPLLAARAKANLGRAGPAPRGRLRPGPALVGPDHRGQRRADRPDRRRGRPRHGRPRGDRARAPQVVASASARQPLAAREVCRQQLEQIRVHARTGHLGK